ncbi:unnamed protein product [Arctia plantaginis]|uniref:PiggyBac transposable element-derived protein domain-containing protein n=1 Tax=Arctia plantaginis TaxID=874455 RepID=A0A8S0Z8Z5_ARCPL|nr:unnamed protein product [Arctia plantaginis]
MDETVRPLDVFLKFFDDDFFDLLVRQSNRYATVIIEKELTDHSRLNFWKSTNRDEMAIFLAILVALAEEKDYWRENGFLTLKYLQNLMTHNTFVLLKKLLHFTPTTIVQTTGNMTEDEIKLRKIQPVLDHLQRKFSTLYLPGRDIVIDESLLKWHGR